MRHALVSLIAALAVSAPAVAQDAATPAPDAPAPTPVDVASPPPAVTPAPAAEAVPAPAPATTEAAPAPAPAVIAAPEPEPAPALPPTPNDPMTLRILSMLDQVCKPLVAGGDIQAIAKPLGFKKKRDAWTLALQKPASITVIPSAANPNVCDLEVVHVLGGDEAITIGLHNWAISQGYTLYRNDAFTTDLKRHTRSWELTTDGKTEALVLVTETKPDGTGTVKNGTRSTVMYSVR